MQYFKHCSSIFKYAVESPKIRGVVFYVIFSLKIYDTSEVFLTNVKENALNG